MSRAAIQATYSDLKIIKGRKVCQVVCEIPLEQAEGFIAAFGMPNPAAETWVAIARLNKDAKRPPQASEKPAKRWADLPLSQQAAMRCGERSFQRYLEYERIMRPLLDGEKDAAEYVRNICGVSSRSDIGKTEESAREWKRLDADYQFWMRNAA